MYGSRTRDKVDSINRLNSRYKESYELLDSNFKRETGVLFDRFNSDEAIKLSSLIVSKASRTLGKDNVRLITTSNYKSVNIKERDYILANPTLFRRAKGQTINAYRNKKHTLREPDIMPRHRDDFIDVMSGVSSARTPLIHTMRTSRENGLNNYERLSVMSSWENALKALENDLDLTDI
jgi:hypothetical protein